MRSSCSGPAGFISRSSPRINSSLRFKWSNAPRWTIWSYSSAVKLSPVLIPLSRPDYELIGVAAFAGNIDLLQFFSLKLGLFITRIGREFFASQVFNGSGNRQDFRLRGGCRNSWPVPLHKNSQLSSVSKEEEQRFFFPSDAAGYDCCSTVFPHDAKR